MENQQLTTNLSFSLPLSEAPVEDGTISTINARDLHAFLGPRSRFNDWISSRLEEHPEFVENQDFVSFTSNSVKVGRPIQEYHLSIDMAKQLAMAEKTEKGLEARRYFLDCEKRLKAVHVDLQPLLDRISKLEEDNHRLESWAYCAVDWIRYLDENDLQRLDATGRIGRLVKEHHGYFMEVIDALTALEDRIDYIARLAPGRGKHKRVSDFLRKGPKPV